jgi:hypothetical protein
LLSVHSAYHITDVDLVSHLDLVDYTAELVYTEFQQVQITTRSLHEVDLLLLVNVLALLTNDFSF